MAQEDQKKNWVGIAAAVCCITFVGMGLSLGLLLLSFVLQDRGTSGTMMGFVAAMGGVATVVMSPIVPKLVRKLGTLAVLLTAIAVAAFSFLAFHWAGPLWIWFVLRFVNGAGISIVLIVIEFWINSMVPPKRRGLIMGFYAASQSIGFALGPVLINFLDPKEFLAFAIASGLILIGGIPAVLGRAEAPVVETKSRRRVLSFVFTVPSATLAAFTFGAAEAGMNLLPNYGLDSGLTEHVAALLATAIALGNVFFQIPLGHFADKLGRRRVLLACGTVSLCCISVLPFVIANIWLVLPLLAVFGGAVATLYSVGVAHLASRYKGAELASANAAFVMLYSAGRLVGPPVVGGGLDLWKPNGYVVAMALFLAVYVIVVAIRGLTQRTSAADDPKAATAPRAGE